VSVLAGGPAMARTGEAHLRALIAAEGPITVARFMAEALGHPEHGYYRTRDPLGAAGDFTTAPEIAQAFGELIGAWCAVVWEQAGRPDPVMLLELGPGRGTLMADALRAVAKVAPAFDKAAELHLVETSPVLRKAQAEALGGRPRWHDALDEIPRGPTILIANEFFDALPVHQLVRRGGAWHERLVAADRAGAAFRFAVSDTPSTLDTPPVDAAEGDILEVSPARAALAAAIARRLAAHCGGALIIDYGHAASAPGDTLQAVRRHQPVPVLEAAGEADLTAHVDFAALARAAEGVAVYGPVAQGGFLRALGIEARSRALAAAAPDARTRDLIESATARLTEPGQMGSLFKALALIHATQPQPPGFETDRSS
jgi:NADH dehydrogenase [ubiquinone] 1 alpha subcomplex assembly factor 7